MTELYQQAIESAKCRIYRLKGNGSFSESHQKKAENQIELMNVTISALEKQIPKKPSEQSTSEKTHYKCMCGYILKTVYKDDDITHGHESLYCEKCGQKIDWSDYNE